MTSTLRPTVRPDGVSFSDHSNQRSPTAWRMIRRPLLRKRAIHSSAVFSSGAPNSPDSLAVSRAKSVYEMPMMPGRFSTGVDAMAAALNMTSRSFWS